VVDPNGSAVVDRPGQVVDVDVVTEDVALPQTYRAKDPVSGTCYWEINSDANGKNIVANDIVTGGRPTVTLSSGQYFTTKRCGDWAKVS
jgi:hypothetical protein